MKRKYKNIPSILKKKSHQILIHKIYLTKLTRTFCIISEEKNFAKEKKAQNYLDEASSNTLKTFCKSGIRFWLKNTFTFHELISKIKSSATKEYQSFMISLALLYHDITIAGDNRIVNVGIKKLLSTRLNIASWTHKK